ncbi:uncharacterized protein LOC124164111 [Ischnura elegans]|uniref:uncharacterized protein LOC124164111 n=1 Tax=Ischnura elegans TaxID=197161 RepID=UPI001ED86951|nr:uncharacterized protein LOC124164111 [Ischnura elegans]
MARGTSSNCPAAHGAFSCRGKSLVLAAAMLLLCSSSAVVTSGCGTSDASAPQEMMPLFRGPWSLFRRTQCPSSNVPEVTYAKRNQQEVTAPCTCDTQLKILDLGSSRFPRYLPSVDCRVAASDCSQGILCKQRPYKVRVLRRRHLPSANEEAGEEDEESEEDDALPESLRSVWRFEEMDINVACECKSIRLHPSRP